MFDAPELEAMAEALEPCGMCDTDLIATIEHLTDAETFGIEDQGLCRIPWLVENNGFVYKVGGLDSQIACELVPFSDNTWRVSGKGRVGYSLMKAAVNYPYPQGAFQAPQLVIVDGCFPSGALGIWARYLADKGWASVITATSQKRVPHPGGEGPRIGTTPICVCVPSPSDRRHMVADLALTDATYGDVLMGRADSDQLRFPTMKLWALGIALETMVRSMSASTSAVLMFLFRPALESVADVRYRTDKRLPGDR